MFWNHLFQATSQTCCNLFPCCRALALNTHKWLPVGELTNWIMQVMLTRNNLRSFKKRILYMNTTLYFANPYLFVFLPVHRLSQQLNEVTLGYVAWWIVPEWKHLQVINQRCQTGFYFLTIHCQVFVCGVIMKDQVLLIGKNVMNEIEYTMVRCKSSGFLTEVKILMILIHSQMHQIQLNELWKWWHLTHSYMQWVYIKCVAWHLCMISGIGVQQWAKQIPCSQKICIQLTKEH